MSKKRSRQINRQGRINLKRALKNGTACVSGNMIWMLKQEVTLTKLKKEEENEKE